MPLFIFFIAFILRFIGLLSTNQQGNGIWLHPDEPTYIAAGIWYVNFGYWSFNFEHPSFFKVIVGAILWFAGIRSTPWIPSPWPVKPTIPYGLPPDLPLPPPNVVYFARLPSVVLGSLTPVLIYLLARKIMDSRLNALFSGLFLSLYPTHIHYSRTATLDVPVTFFITLTLWFMYKTLTQSNKRYFVAASIAYAMALGTKLPAIMIFPVSIALSASFPDRKRKIIRVGLLTLFALAIFIVISPYLWSDPLGNFVESVAYQIKYHIGSDAGSLFGIDANLPNLWWIFFVFLATPLPMLLFTIFGLIIAFRNLKDPMVSPILAWFLVPLFFMTLLIPLPWNNYFVWLTPSLSIISGYGSTIISQLNRKNRRDGFLAVVIILTILLVVSKYPSYEWPLPF